MGKGKEVAKLGRNDEAAAFQVADDLSLGELEEVIGDNLDAFIAVGVALGSIRDRGLWKETHDSFATYCSERWGLSRSAAWRRIAQAQESVGAGKRKPQRVSRGARQLADPTTPNGSIDVDSREKSPLLGHPMHMLMALQKMRSDEFEEFNADQIKYARDLFADALAAKARAAMPDKPFARATVTPMFKKGAK